MRAVREILASLDFDMARYHEESLGTPAFDGVPVEIVSPATVPEITCAGSGKATVCDGTDTVLAAAKRAVLNISSSCNFGQCGTCKVKKLCGGMAMAYNGGISDDQIADGFTPPAPK